MRSTCVVYMGPGKVEVQNIDFPELKNPKGKKIGHGVILKVISTNICGSDQHMVRGRTTAQARSFGCETVDLTQEATLAEQNTQILGIPEVDCAVDCVGFEAHGGGSTPKEEVPAAVLNSLMEIARAGGSIGIPGLYVTADPGSKDAAAQKGSLSI